MTRNLLSRVAARRLATTETETVRLGERTAPSMLAGLCVCLVLAGVALAGSLPAANSGTIEPYVSTSGLSAAGSQFSYQSSVAFKTTGGGGLKNPRVWVACYQNGSLVYGEGGAPSTTFKLGGDMSQWVLNGGGPADCTADLYYILNAKGTGEWNGRGAQGGNVYLGHASFAAAG